jgi:hypothetical protein
MLQRGWVEDIGAADKVFIKYSDCSQLLLSLSSTVGKQILDCIIR